MSSETKETNVECEDRLYKYWKDCEDITMHFNDLLARLRLQSLAGIAAIPTLLAFGLGSGGKTVDWNIMLYAFIAMLIAWISICCLDLLYYNRLLHGAVKEIIRVEQRISQSEVELSQVIKRAVPAAFNHSIGPLLFYLLVSIVMVGFIILSAFKICE
ncbi:MAG: hypothetical protein ACSHX4_10525 [Opitutaceae bacterium]